MKDFINRKEVINRVKKVYQDTVKDWNNYFDGLIDEETLDDLCEEEAERTGNSCADSFNRYFLSKDYHIWGNFAHLEINYNHDHKDSKHFWQVFDGLVNGTLSDKETQEFKDWAVGWFFDTFGTYNLGYNFSDTLTNFYWDEIQEFEDRKEAEEKGLVYDPTCKQLELAI